MNFWILFLVFALLVAADKGLTYINIKQVNKNFDLQDEFGVEKNPFAKYLFETHGLNKGTLLYIPISILSLFIVYWFLRIPFNERISLYVIMMIYGLVIMNNTYFLLKYSRLIS